MSLMQRIKTYQLEARKIKDTVAANVLTTLIGEATSVGKNDGNRETTDAEIVAVIKKFVKNIDETLKVTDAPHLRDERSLLMGLLPAQITKEQLLPIIAAIFNEVGATTPKDMGKVMKVLKERFDGQYDGAVASTLIRQGLGG
jgi:uncharacterized protein YqeY